jgi:nucleoside-diphosphate-sugar epimerase
MEGGDAGEIYNLGNPEEVTILELAKEIERLLGSKVEVVWHSLPEDDPRRRCPDISKALDCLGWQPRISLQEGLQKTINYFKVAR